MRILSGNYAGLVVEMEQGEGESALATGYAERVPDEDSSVAEPVTAADAGPGEPWTPVTPPDDAPPA